MLCKDLSPHFFRLIEKFESSSRAQFLFELCLPMGFRVSENHIQFFNAYESPLGFPKGFFEPMEAVKKIYL